MSIVHRLLLERTSKKRLTYHPHLEVLEDRSVPSAYSITVQADDPLAYIRLGETSGLTAVDSSGNGNFGSYNNAPTLGQAGALAHDSDLAVQFDGINDHVMLSNRIGGQVINGVVVGGDFTLEAWIRTTATSLTGTQAYQGNGLVWSDVSGTHNDFILAILNNRLSFFTGNPDRSVNGTTVLNDGQWHHVVATRVRGGATAIYVDGRLEGTGVSNNNALNANALIMLGGNTLDRRYFNGAMDEVALYDTQLTASQVLAHYNAARNRNPVARDDVAATQEGAAVNVNVLGNDSDPEGAILAIVSSTQAAHGTLSLNNGVFLYTPNPGFVGADSFTYTIGDGGNGFAMATVFLTVESVVPEVSVGADATLDEGGLFAQAGFFADPGDFTWTVTADYGDGSGAQLLAYNPDRTFELNHQYGQKGSYTVTVVVTDNDGNRGSDSLVVTVNNVAPQLSVGADAMLDEGSVLTQSGAFSDPGDSVWTLTVDYGDGSGLQNLDYNPDGAFQLSHLYDQNGSYMVTVVVTDNDGVSDSDSLMVTVNNVPPTAAVDGPSTTVRGQKQRFSFSAADVSSTDDDAGFTYAVNWGDGSAVEIITPTAGNGVGFSLDHTFTDAGSFTVQVSVRDQDGGAVTETHAVHVASAALQPDSLDPSKTILVIGGTQASDLIIVEQLDAGPVRVWVNGQNLGVFSPTSRIVVLAQDGNDVVYMDHVRAAAWLYAGNGDDWLFAGKGNDVLLGGAGNDFLWGAAGRDLLIGGLGSDWLHGQGGGDILVGGATAIDDDEAALAALHYEWTSALKPGFASFSAALAQGAATWDDLDRDRLQGGKRQDWFVAGRQGVGRDHVVSPGRKDVVTKLK